METKLLPCPHCGGEAELDEYCGRYVVFCKNSKCSWRDTEAEAIEAWNTRHERTVTLKDNGHCPDCNRLVGEGERYCAYCGARVKEG